MRERLRVISGISEQNKFIRGFVDIIVDAFARKREVLGRESLNKVRKLLAGGNKIIFTPNHLSNADAPVISKALTESGFADLEQKLVFLLGQRLAGNPLRKGFRFIDVWPKTMTPTDEEEKLTAWRMNGSGLRATKEALDNDYIILIFPEGTRARNGSLGKAVPEVSHYLQACENTYFVPIGITGTEKILPPGAKWPKFGEVTISFGEPVSVSSLDNSIPKDLPKPTRKQLLVDRIMRGIANLLPENYRGVYGFSR